MTTRDAVILEGIMTGKSSDIVQKYLAEGKSIPMKHIKFGMSYSPFEIQNGNFRRHNPSQKIHDYWIHTLAYCEDSGVEEFIEEIMYNDPRNLGACLCVLYMINVDKAMDWLELIHEFDPNFQLLKMGSSPFVSKLVNKYRVKETDLFNMLYMEGLKADTGKLQQVIEPLLITQFSLEVDGRMDRDKNEKIRVINQERQKVIKSNTLSSDQADLIFDKLWNSNIEFTKNPKSEILERNLRYSIISHYDKYWSPKYRTEVQQLFEIIPQLSEKKNSMLIELFDSLPFWDDQYKTLSETIYRIHPSKYYESWKDLVVAEKDQISNKKGWGVASPRPHIATLINNMIRMNELGIGEFQKFLVSLINHHSEEMRSAVQKFLSGEPVETTSDKSSRSRLM